MHPEATYIAAPQFAPGVGWIGEDPIAVERLCARGPLLVHFICAGDPGSVRTLPYLRAWNERYGEAGLTVLAVNTPRFPFSADAGRLAAALGRLDVDFPVAVDSERAIWDAYGCEGWPSLFLWQLGGTLGWFHFGQGEYDSTEREIQSLLDPPVEAEIFEPVRAIDAPDALVMPPSAEVFPGGSIDRPWSGGELSLEYEAGGATATVEGSGAVLACVDGGDARRVEVDAPGVYELSAHERHGPHRLTLSTEGDTMAYAVSFTPGLP